MKEANDLRIKVVDQERLRKLDEANAWATIDFKNIGATSDKLRSAAVSREMNKFPNVAAQNKAKLIGIESEIKLIRETLGLMKEFGVETIEFTENKDEESSDKAS